MPLPTCSICIEPFTQPVSLPCGHVFCRLCIRKNVESEASKSSTLHLCPSCRTPYSIITIDPALVPSHMRPHIRPSMRPLFLDSSSPAPSPLPPAPLPQPQAQASSESSSLAQAQAEIAALRLACSVWRRRAEQHATANHGLLSFARAAKDCALRLRSERDSARSRCTLLKRTLAETVECQSDMLGAPGDNIRAHLTTDAADYAADTKHAQACVGMGLGGGGGLPVYLVQAATRPASHFYDNPADVEASHFGPPMKRRKIIDDASPTGTSNSMQTTTNDMPPSTTFTLPIAAPALETLASVSLGSNINISEAIPSIKHILDSFHHAIYTSTLPKPYSEVREANSSNWKDRAAQEAPAAKLWHWSKVGKVIWKECSFLPDSSQQV
ncbi:RING-type domain-containing protein [Mycena indigotica]|uniref:RING-type domain-containing protein n=1 Tax=Mycena indigotica TaxID=2126181 RepID=A0A8H6VS48_9AGAR|nr:RING-type domain-containing protein [Mycena indigotica]KAF7291977.1 RING-type domain-containing protein [Mycena indigotica]